MILEIAGVGYIIGGSVLVSNAATYKPSSDN